MQRFAKLLAHRVRLINGQFDTGSKARQRQEKPYVVVILMLGLIYERTLGEIGFAAVL